MSSNETPSLLLGRAQNRFAFFAWLALAFNVGVILWGAYVRATGSGAGCGGHWPLCNGEVIPRAAKTATLIEYTHRVTSGMVLVVVVLLLFFAFRLFPVASRVRNAAVLTGIFTLTEALLGASLVLLGYVAENTSVWRGVVLGVHLVNTLLLLSSLALTAWFAATAQAEPEPPMRPEGGWRIAWMLAIAAIVLTGATGAITALGDTLFSSPTLAAGMRMDFSAASHPFVRMRVFHPIFSTALTICLLVVGFVVLHAERASRTTRHLAEILIALTFLQPVMGVVDFVLMAPVWLQLLHLLGADLLVITFVLLSAQVLLSGKRRPGRTRAGAA